jgi:hypothetical protein
MVLPMKLFYLTQCLLCIDLTDMLCHIYSYQNQALWAWTVGK